MLPTGVVRARYRVTIYLDSGQTIVLNESTEVVGPNYLDSLTISQRLSGPNNNPVGVIAANTLSLELTSKDLSLDPTNQSSPYYGHMYSTAWIHVDLIMEDDTIVNMGNYYVDTWQPNITNSTPYSVSIEAVDLLSIISKMKVPYVQITFGMTLQQYLGRVFDALNETIEERYHINYDVSTMIFGVWSNFNYQQLDTTNMGDMLNTISQCTLTNLYIDEDNFFRTDYLCDDTPADAVMSITANTDTYKASLAPAATISYNGVQVSYIPNDEDAEDTLATLNNLELVPGDNEFKDVSLGGNAFRITSIDIDGDDLTNVYVKKVKYDKDLLTLTVHNLGTANTNANITVLGISAKTDPQILEEQNSSTVYDMKNPILNKDGITSFSTLLKTLMDLKEKSISLTGYYNPQLRVGDLINVVIGGDFNTIGLYKLSELSISLSSGGLTYDITMIPSLVAV